MNPKRLALLMLTACAPTSVAPPPVGTPSAAEAPGGAQAEAARRTEELEVLGYASSFEASANLPGAHVLVPDRVSPGLNLWDSNDDSVVYLTDASGREVHRWSSSLATVLPDAIRGRPDDHHQHHFSRVDVSPSGDLWAMWQTYGLVKLDRQSRVQWAVPGGFHHHLELQPDGTAWVISNERGPTDAFGARRWVWRDRVEHIAADGTRIDVLDLLDALEADPAQLNAVFPTRPRDPDLFHVNSVRVVAPDAIPGLPTGTNLLLSVRNPSVLLVVNAERRRVVWIERGPWRQQHDATALGGGRIQLFDNLGGPGGTARAMVWDSVHDQVVWSWPSGDAPPLRAKMLGAVQALPAGNVLVTNAFAGDVYEVTDQGELVWQFTNPHQMASHRAADHGALQTAVILSMRRIPPGWFGAWLPTTTP